MSDDMEETVERPRIQQVFVIGSDEPLPASRYLETDRRTFAEIRLEHETAILSNNPIARCAACHRPVKPRRHYKYNRRYFKHHEGDGKCPYKTSGPASQRQIDAMRYNGQKEGPDHIRLKGLLASSIESDITFDNIRIEERWWGVADEEKWKKPDVAADYLGFPVAFEIQLSTTFLNVMADRRMFYQENGAILVWIFKDVHKEASRQFQDDIFYNNNSNIFVVDEETAMLSDENIELTLRCHYLKPVLQGCQIVEEWQEELVSFSKLTIDQENQRIYFFDFAEAEKKLKQDLQESADADLRERFLDYWSALGLYASGTDGITGEWPTKWNKMVADFKERGISLPADQPHYDLARFSCLTFSTYHAKSIGFAYKSENFLQVANYAFDNCKDLLWYFGDLLERTGNYRNINEQDKKSREKKLSQGKKHKGWDIKWPIVKAVYRESDPTYPQKRNFDDLYSFIFAGRKDNRFTYSKESLFPSSRLDRP